MMKIMVNNNRRTYKFPVPYTLLRLASRLLTSRFVQRKLRKRLDQLNEPADWRAMPGENPDTASNRLKLEVALAILENASTKPALREVIQELQHYKGMALIDVQSQDGRRFRIEL
ncbi:hypothetical protein [Paenibacillus daejeonensis]|uniref:hypothetical protein n=1 Tax=Paenibacillus daejeonensis TaxID=135193 RepID=UPI00036048EE|nr:hypothetical protein [Paenibacillus daejeonensis]